MWRTTAILDTSTLIFDQINFNAFNQAKGELTTVGGGSPVAGWNPPTIKEEFADSKLITVKRDWNSEQNARAFSNLLSEKFGDLVTVTIEHQVNP